MYFLTSQTVDTMSVLDRPSIQGVSLPMVLDAGKVSSISTILHRTSSLEKGWMDADATISDIFMFKHFVHISLPEMFF